jgi:DNA-binding NarL/FixJ family response regulator
MAAMSGTKVCRLLKQSKPDLRVVLFSNIHERDLERKAKECEADDGLSKQLSPNEWIARIEKVIFRT